MMRHEIRRWVLLLVVCLVLAGILPVALLPVASAQDQTPQPTTPASGREVVATAVAEGTPVVAEAASGAVAGLSDLTMQNVLFLLAYFGIIILAVVYGSQLISHLLSRLARRTSTTLDDALVKAIRPQIRWLIAAIGFQIVTIQLEFITGFWESVLRTSYFLLYWFVGMSTCWRAIDISLQWYVERQGQDMDARVRDQLLPLGRRLALILLAVFGIGILLAHFGVNLLAAAGVLGLTGFAISLAAKDTITNIISGIVIMFDAPFTVGDRIDLKDLDAWGDVLEIGLRSTRVVTRDNRLVIIPNSAIVDNQVVNYSLPDPTYRLQVDLGIGSTVDHPWVKETLENAVRGVEGVLVDKPVDILFTGFGDSSNTYRVRWWVSSPGEKRRVTDGVCAAIQKAANEMGIDMPQPAFTLDNRVKIGSEDAAALLRGPSAPESEQARAKADAAND